MTFGEFATWLSGKFPKDRSEMDSEDLLRILPRKIEENKLDDLKDKILENYEYKTFPSVAYILKQCEGLSTIMAYDDPVIKYCRVVAAAQAHWKKMAVSNLVREGIHYRNKLVLGKATMMDKEFIHCWDGLISEYGIMKDMNKEPVEMQRHLEYVKDCIVKGENFDSIKKTEIMKDPARTKKIIPLSEALKFLEEDNL